MKRNAYFLAAILFVASQIDAACVQKEAGHYDCQGGFIYDIGYYIPDNAAHISIHEMSVGRIISTLFANFSNLQSVTCTKCLITDVADGAFSGLKNLTTLELRDNYLKEANAAWFGEDDVPLTSLDLQDNIIERVDGNLLRKATNLRFLNIAGNKLQCLEVEHMSGLEHLESIDVRDNRYFNDDCWDKMKKIRD